MKRLTLSRERKGDLWLLAVLLAVPALLLAARWLLTPAGTYVTVAVDGKPVGRYALSQPMTLPIVTPYGTNTLTVAHGAASVTEADCPDKLCVAHRPVSRVGETVVCLPHRLTVTVEAAGETAPDAVT